MSAAAAELPVAPAPPPASAASPYKFLDFYVRDDAPDFAGREQEIDDIAAGVARGRCFVLYGRSGLGKTSLLHAGVIPLLEQRGFEVKYVRILASPVGDLCAAIAAHVGRDSVSEQELPAVLAARPRPFVLVLDQFEEFFIRFRDQPRLRAHFTALIGKILDEGAGWVRLLVTVREDYYAELEDLETAIPDLTAQRHRLVLLSAYGVRQAVVRPLIRSGIAYEEKFVDQVVDELAAFDFDPLLLQIVCGEAYDDAVREARANSDAAIELRAAYVERGGGIPGALARYVTSMSESLAGDDRLIACAVLDALTTAENTKRALRFSDLLPRSGTPATTEAREAPGSSFYMRVTPEELRQVLDHLSLARLVRQVHREAPPGAETGAGAAGDEWYELLHDRLVPVVNAWLDAEPAFDRFRFAKKLIASLSGGRTWRDEPGGLLSATQLAQQVEPYAQRLLLSTTEAEYVLRSAIQDQSGLVPTWARLYDEAAGAGSAAWLLIKLVAHSDPTVRRSAARAIADVADPKAGLPALCAKLALEDPIEEVRRAAGRSLARVAGNAEVNVIQQSLEMKATRGRAVEAVTDLVQFGSPEQIAGFPRLIRITAGWYRKRRVYREHKERIRDRASIAAIHGLVAAVVFVLVAGIPAFAALAFITSPATVTNHWPVEWLLTTARNEGVALFAAVFASVLLGWRSGTHLARREALAGRASAWAGAGVRGSTSALVTYVLLFGALAFGVGQLDGLEWGALLAAVITAIWWQLGPIAARWIYRTFKPGCPIARAAIWSTIAGAGLASVPTAAFAWLLNALGVDRDHGMAVLVILLFLVVGLNLCVTGLVLYGDTQSIPAAERPASSAGARRRARSVAVAGFIGSPIVAAVVLGPSWTPLVPMRVSLATRSEIELQAIPARSHPTYFRIEDVQRDSIVWANSYWVDSYNVYHYDDDLVVEGSRPREGRIVRAGGTVLAAGTWSADAHSSWKVRMAPIYESASAIPATSDRWTFAWTPVTLVAPGVYHGEVRGSTIARPSFTDSRVQVQLAWPASDYECGEHHKGAICPSQPLDSDIDGVNQSVVAMQPTFPDGTWLCEFTIDAPSRASLQSFEILVGYRLTY